MGILCLGTFVFGIKLKVLVPDGILVPTPLERRPSSFANDVAQISLMVHCMRCLYSRDTPVSGLMTAFILCAVVEITELIARIVAAMEYLDLECIDVVDCIIFETRWHCRPRVG